VKDFCLLFLMQTCAYAMVTFSFRAVAMARYTESVVVDVLYSSMMFWVIRRVAKSDDTKSGWIGYTAGSAFGTVVGIWSSKLILGN
jgi:hypothetical protein